MTAPATTRPVRPLTAKEIQMLALLADGHNHRQIASRIGGMNKHAVSVALSRVYPRMGATGATHAVAIAIRTGLIPATTAGDNA